LPPSRRNESRAEHHQVRQRFLHLEAVSQLVVFFIRFRHVVVGVGSGPGDISSGSGNHDIPFDQPRAARREPRNGIVGAGLFAADRDIRRRSDGLRQAFVLIPRTDDARLAEIFAREVLADLVRKELLSPEWAERLLSWRHSGFNVHSLVRVKTKPEAERVGKYMIRPILSLERLSFLEPEGKVGYRQGENVAEQEVMDYLELIARVTSHIPDKGQVMVRYYGLYANAHRGKVKKASLAAFEEELRRIPSKGWAALIRKPHIGLRSAAPNAAALQYS